ADVLPRRAVQATESVRRTGHRRDVGVKSTRLAVGTGSGMTTRKSDPFTIRHETPAARAAIRQVNLAAFGSPLEADLIDALRDGGHVNLSLVAVAEGGVVGHILFSKVRIIAGDNAIEATSLAPMAVLPEYQRRGIGSALVR